MKVHHAKEHNESLAKKSDTCDYCGTEIEYYPSNQEGIACSDCRGNAVSDGKNMGETEECELCGNTVPIEPWEREWKDMFFCDMNCKSDWQEQRSAECHPSWEGGYEYHYGNNWEQKRQEALQRDGFQCRLCGTSEKEIGRKPDVHHIISVREYRQKYGNEKFANRLSNLITLCPSHHQQIEGGSLKLPLTEIAQNV